MDQAKIKTLPETADAKDVARAWNAQLPRVADLLARVQGLNAVSKSAAYTATEADDLIMVDTSGGGVTITLPPAQRSLGHVFYIKKKAAANTLTVACSGSEQIDEAATSAFTADDACRAFLACKTASPATFGYQVISTT